MFASLLDLSLLGVVLLSFLRTYGLLRHSFVLLLPVLPGPFHVIPRHWAFTVFYLRPVPMLLFAVICIAYFTVFEAAVGWTPGKLVFGIRVVDFYGGTPTV